MDAGFKNTDPSINLPQTIPDELTKTKESSEKIGTSSDGVIKAKITIEPGTTQSREEKKTVDLHLNVTPQTTSSKSTSTLQSFKVFLKSIFKMEKSTDQAALKTDRVVSKHFTLESKDPADIEAEREIFSKDILSIKIDNEPNAKVLMKANEIIGTFKEGTKLFVGDGLSFEMVQKLKEAKKEAKGILNQTTPISADTKNALEQVIKQYDKIVESVEVLSDLRKISQLLREAGKAGKNPKGLWLDHFKGLIGKPNKNDSYFNDLAGAYRSNKRTWNKQWSSIRSKMFSAALEAHSHISKGQKISYVSGTKSSSLVPILKAKIGDKPALYPTGTLMKHNIVPLAGELNLGIQDRGVNQQFLSGTTFDGLETCIGYASNKGFTFDKKTELNYVNNFKLGNLGKDQVSIPRLRIAVLRLLLMQPETAKECKQIEPRLEKLIQEADTGNKKLLMEIKELFKPGAINPYEVGTEEMKLIKDPFPIVWGSVSLKPDNVKGGIDFEVTVKEKATLGDDIQIVFTNSENVDKVHQLVKGQGIQVLSFEAAKYILGHENKQLQPRLMELKEKFQKLNYGADYKPDNESVDELVDFYDKVLKLGQFSMKLEERKMTAEYGRLLERYKAISSEKFIPP